MRWLIMLGLFLCMCGLIGCAEGMPGPAGEQAAQQKKETAHRQAAAGAEPRAEEPLAAQDPQPDEGIATKGAGGEKGHGNKEPAGQPVEPVKRKIIFTGSADLSVEDYDKAVREMKALVKNLGGYISNTNVSGKSGGQRTGTYTVRVPVDNFNTFMDDIEQIGELLSSKTNSQDVTDQYYDVEGHLKNDKNYKESLQILQKAKADQGTLDEQLRLRDKIDEIQGKIDVREGQLKRWDSLTSYSTVVVKLEQRKEYAPAGAPDFGTTVSRTWEGSVGALAAFGRGFVLFAVAVVPWVPLFAVVTSPLWFLMWRQWRKSRPGRPAAPAAPAPAAPLPAVVEPV